MFTGITVCFSFKCSVPQNLGPSLCLRSALGDSTPKSLSLLRASLSLPLSKPIARIPVSLSLHRPFWEPQFLEPSRSLARLWLLRFKLGPLPPPSLEAAPARPPGGRDPCDPGGALRGSAPPRLPLQARPQVIAAGPGRGAAAGAQSGDSAPGTAGSSPRSGRRERGSRAARPSAAARTCGPGRAGAERAAGEGAGCTRTVWASGSSAPTPPRGSARGARPSRTPPPAAPARRVRTPPRPRIPQAGGQTPPTPPLWARSRPRAPRPAQSNLALPTSPGRQDPAPVPSLLSLSSLPASPTPPTSSQRETAVLGLRRGVRDPAEQGPLGDQESTCHFHVPPPPTPSLPPGVTRSPSL